MGGGGGGAGWGLGTRARIVHVWSVCRVDVSVLEKKKKKKKKKKKMLVRWACSVGASRGATFFLKSDICFLCSFTTSKIRRALVCWQDKGREEGSLRCPRRSRVTHATQQTGACLDRPRDPPGGSLVATACRANSLSARPAPPRSRNHVHRRSRAPTAARSPTASFEPRTAGTAPDRGSERRTAQRQSHPAVSGTAARVSSSVGAS